MRGCMLQGKFDPTGSSGFAHNFADDSPLHTDGPDAVPTMVIMIPKVAAYLEWEGMEVNVPNNSHGHADGSAGC